MPPKRQRIGLKWTLKRNPLIKEKVRRICEDKQVVAQSYASKLAKVSSKLCANANNSSKKEIRSFSDPFLMRSTNVNVNLNDLKSFPPLKKKYKRDYFNSVTSTPHKGDGVGLSLGISDQCREDSKTPSRKFSEDALLIRILDENIISYNELLAELKKSIDLSSEVGVKSLKMHKSHSGELILAINSYDAYNKINLLANCIRKVTDKYVGNISIMRPRKPMNVVISGTNEFVSPEDIIDGLTSVANCQRDDITYIGKINYKSYSRWSFRIACPIYVGKAIVNLGRIQIGWSWVTARKAPSLLIRCFRCLRTGHTRASCKEKVDRSLCCFKCGNSDHKALMCKNDVFRCLLCMDISNKDANHRLDSPECVCPAFVLSENETQR